MGASHLDNIQQTQNVTIILIFVFSIILIIIGLFNIISYRKMNYIGSFGIVLIIIGIIVMFASPFIEILIRLIIGFTLLFSGFSKLMNPIQSKLFLLKLFIAILLIIGGLYTIFVANLVFMTIGIIIIFFAISKIIDYILSQKNKDIIK